MKVYLKNNNLFLLSSILQCKFQNNFQSAECGDSLLKLASQTQLVELFNSFFNSIFN